MNRRLVNRIIVVLIVITILVLFSFSPFFKNPRTPASVEISNEATSTSRFREEAPEASLSGEVVTVIRVIDGDTIDIEGGRRVRYIGIDTPEMGDGRRGLECFAGEAKEENKRLVDGKSVRLEKDVSDMDQYGRLLRYVSIASSAGEFINDSLVRQGFARVDTVPPDVKFQQQFLEAQREAREQGRGLWGGCP